MLKDLSDESLEFLSIEDKLEIRRFLKICQFLRF